MTNAEAKFREQLPAKADIRAFLSKAGKSFVATLGKDATPENPLVLTGPVLLTIFRDPIITEGRNNDRTFAYATIQAKGTMARIKELAAADQYVKPKVDEYRLNNEAE